MRILLSNDDGVHAPGIFALAQHLGKKHEVYISAPDSERSGASHSITCNNILRARERTLPGLENVVTYAVSGTPTDCVRLAIRNLIPTPDLVISGINMGSNRGPDTLYSGTVGAAMEAVFCGVRALAVSVCGYPPKHYEAALYALDYCMRLMEKKKDVSLLNINAPDAPAEELRGIKLTPTASFSYNERFIEREDMYGVKYYWSEPTRTLLGGDGSDDDMRWTTDGYASVTPLIMNLTDEKLLKKLRKYEKENTE